MLEPALGAILIALGAWIVIMMLSSHYSFAMRHRTTTVRECHIKTNPMDKLTLRNNVADEILAHLRNADYDGARASIRKLHELNLPGDEYYWSGKLLEASGHRAEAEQNLEAACWLFNLAADIYEDYPDRWDMVRHESHVRSLRDRAEKL